MRARWSSIICSVDLIIIHIVPSCIYFPVRLNMLFFGSRPYSHNRKRSLQERRFIFLHSLFSEIWRKVKLIARIPGAQSHTKIFYGFSRILRTSFWPREIVCLCWSDRRMRQRETTKKYKKPSTTNQLICKTLWKETSEKNTLPSDRKVTVFFHRTLLICKLVYLWICRVNVPMDLIYLLFLVVQACYRTIVFFHPRDCVKTNCSNRTVESADNSSVVLIYV